MVGAYPVEARALHDEHFFLREKIAGKLHVVADVEFLNVQLGKNVERAFGAHAAYAVDVVEHFGGDDALVVEPPAGNDKLVDALVAAQCGLDAVLHGGVGAEPHGRKGVQPVDKARGGFFVAREYHPALAEARHAVGFGQAVEGYAKHIRGNGCHVVVDCAVVHDFFVDFVGENHQVMLAGDFGNFFQHGLAVYRAGGVVGVDDDDGFGFFGDFGFDVGDVGKPVG